jgi:hypothetical protein
MMNAAGPGTDPCNWLILAARSARWLSSASISSRRAACRRWRRRRGSIPVAGQFAFPPRVINGPRVARTDLSRPWAGTPSAWDGTWSPCGSGASPSREWPRLSRALRLSRAVRVCHRRCRPLAMMACSDLSHGAARARARPGQPRPTAMLASRGTSARRRLGISPAGEPPGCFAEIRTGTRSGRDAKRSGGCSVIASPSRPACGALAAATVNVPAKGTTSVSRRSTRS